jgi:hypothetical protein
MRFGLRAEENTDVTTGRFRRRSLKAVCGHSGREGSPDNDDVTSCHTLEKASGKRRVLCRFVWRLEQFSLCLSATV